MFVNNLAFVITFWLGIDLIAAEFILMRMAQQLECNLTKVIHLYSRADLFVQTILIDMKFEKVIPEIRNLFINTSRARENVGEIEQYIRIVKERIWAIIPTFPLQQIPNIMTISLIHFCIFWLKITLIKTGGSQKFSPRELICHQKPDANRWSNYHLYHMQKHMKIIQLQLCNQGQDQQFV